MSARIGFDNQGRNLAAVKSHFELIHQLGEQSAASAQQEFERIVEAVPLAEWTEVDGVQVLRCGSSNCVAVPHGGQETAKRFDIVDLATAEFLTQLKASEVRTWLWSRAKTEAGL